MLTVSWSPTARVTGLPLSVKWAQKPSELELVMAKEAEPAVSVRVFAERPLKSQAELLARAWFWLLASAKESSRRVAAAGSAVTTATKTRTGARRRRRSMEGVGLKACAGKARCAGARVRARR